MSVYPIQSTTLGEVRTYPLRSRRSKVTTEDFAKVAARGASATRFLDSLPNILAARDLRDLAASLHAARKRKRAILWGIGGHVIKVGLAPLLIDRWSPRSMTGEPLVDEDLFPLFEAARWAPSSYNCQLWPFIIARRQNQEEFERLSVF